MKKPTDRVVVRRLGLGDMDAAARVHRAAFDDQLPWLSGLHTPDEDLAYFKGPAFETCAIWGAFDRRALIGIIAFRDGWVDQLHILPSAQGRGTGSRLLAIAKEAFPSLSLWTFQRNNRARRFYEHHGFAAVQLTDGAANEEKEPDVLYWWARASNVRSPG